MSKISASRKKLLAATAVAALATACATLDSGVAWNILPPGSTWEVEQRNTGSYGKDATAKFTRGEAMWNGQQAVTFTNAANGVTVMSTPKGTWMAMVGRDGKALITYDPPIGYVYPLKVGNAWSTKHKVTLANGNVVDVTYSCKVEAREPVTVPAGTFDTFRIACDNPTSRDVSWTIVDMGMHAKQEFNRFASHPQGAGTQRSQLLSVKRAP